MRVRVRVMVRVRVGVRVRVHGEVPAWAEPSSCLQDVRPG